MPIHTTSKDAPTLSPTDEKARTAVRVFRGMQSTLSAFARNLTGIDTVRVEMSPTSNGHTDGKVIYFRPPIALGDMRAHQRNLCDKRDSGTGIMLCVACALREQVLVTVYHEISHIAFGTFDKADEDSRKLAIQEAVKGRSDAYAEVFKKRMDKAHPAAFASYIGLTRVISPYLPSLFNSLEDARIDSKMFQARPGTRKMYEADNKRIFEEGVEDADGSIWQWRDSPLNAQVYVALYTKIIDYDYSEWFAKKVVDDLDDKTLSDLCEKIRQSNSVKEVFYLGLEFLVRLKQLGYCAEEDDPTPESEETQDPNPQPEGETSEENEDESDVQPEGSEGGISEPTGDGDETESRGGEGSADETSDEPEREEGPSGGNDPEAPGTEDSTDGSEHGQNDSSDSQDEHDNKEGESQLEDGSGEFDEHDGPEESPDSSSEPDPDGDALDGESESGGVEDESEGVHHSGGSDSGGASLGGISETDETGKESSESDDALPEDEVSKVPGEASGDLSGHADDNVPGEEEATGVRLIEDEANDEIPMGDWRDVEEKVKFVHLDKKPETMEESKADQSAVDKAIIQGIYFETPSRNITGVREHYYGQPVMSGEQNMSGAWDTSHAYHFNYSQAAAGRGMDLTIPESILGPALLKMRAVFADNKRSGQQKHLKSGKINSRVLGRRAHFEDERLFKRKLIPAKKDYFVQIGWDISSSNFGTNIKLGKRAIMAQAVLLSRIGVNFSIIAHSGNYHEPESFRQDGMDLEIYHIKDADEPFNSEVRKRLDRIGPDAANLDGHALEYLRRCVDKRTESDRIILYYSDGKMPAENYNEELIILRREIATCKQRGYTLLGVGINTDSPTKHGLETVEVNEDADIVRVVRQLERRLAVR